MTDRRKSPKAKGSFGLPARGAKTPRKGKKADVGADLDVSEGEEGSSARAAPDYEVGYRRPPRHTQFQKGQPRPPRKPKPEVEQSFEDWFEEELRTPMKFVDENGDEQVLPKGKVLAKAAINKALKSGDIRQIRDLLPRRPEKTDSEVSKADLETVARFFANRFGVEIAIPMGEPGNKEETADATWPQYDEEGGQ